MPVRFGVFVPQGWRMDLTEIDDPIEQYETMTRVARVADEGGWDSIRSGFYRTACSWWHRENTVGNGTVVPYISPVRRNRAKYRRRRLGALFVASALAVALYVGGVAGAEPQPVHYTVAPGDTLWGIAIEHTAVWEDPRPKVEAIREANDLSGYEIYPGMNLKVPSTV